MVLASRLLVAVAVAGLFATPIYADIIPTQHAPESKAKETVRHQLVNLGETTQAARDCAARLTEKEAAFFAQDPGRVQVVGQAEMWAGQTDLLWWEWVFGILALAGSIFAIAWATRDGSS